MVGRKKTAQEKPAPKNPPRITVELDTVDFRDQAQRAVRRLGYMTLSDFVREKLQEAIKNTSKIVVM